MLIAINALIPIIFLIMLGAFLRRINFFEDSLWPSLEKLSYYVFTPILLISVISSNQVTGIPWDKFALSIYIPLLGSAMIFWASRLIIKGDGPRFTSIFQGGVRYNTFVALALANSLFGEQGLIMGAMVSGFMIILINLLCVTTFSVTLRTQSNIVKTVALQIAKNPLIIGCVIGGLLQFTGLQLPSSLKETLSVLGRASLPIALITVGAALRFKSLFRNASAFGAASSVQFVIKPLLTALCCVWMGIDGTLAVILVLFLATPTAPSSYILSRQLGGDSPLMASLITQQTLMAFVTLPVTLWILSKDPTLQKDRAFFINIQVYTLDQNFLF